MAERPQSPPVWQWILGAVVILALVLGTLRIIDAIFSLPVLILAIVVGGGYWRYRTNQKTSA